MPLKRGLQYSIERGVYCHVHLMLSSHQLRFRLIDFGVDEPFIMGRKPFGEYKLIELMDSSGCGES